MTEQWHTLTVRFATREPIADNPAIRITVDGQEPVLVDDQWLFRADQTVPISPVAAISINPGCGSCLTCDPPKRSPLSGLPMMRMYVCAACGNKRCPASNDCRKWECSGSNDPEQVRVLREVPNLATEEPS